MLFHINSICQGSAAYHKSWCFFVGSLKYSKNFTHFDYVNPNAPKRGKISLAAIGGFDDFNPYNGQGEVAPGAGLLYDRLLQRAYDEPGSEYGLIAEEITYSDNHKWVEYKLRPEAKFSDGHVLTADDVIFSFNLLREKGDPLYRYYYANVQKVIKLSPHHVRFEFDMAGNRELPLITGQLPILPQHYWKNRDFTKVSLEVPVVSGEYVIKSFEPNRRIIYQRNPHYWAKNLPVRQGMHNFDQIIYELFRDQNVAFEAFKAGQYDYHQESRAKNWATAYEFQAVTQDVSSKKALRI